MVAYTDGSQEIGKLGDPLGAGNWYSTQGMSLGDSQEVYDAELTAMLEQQCLGV